MKSDTRLAVAIYAISEFRVTDRRERRGRRRADQRPRLLFALSLPVLVWSAVWRGGEACFRAAAAGREGGRRAVRR